MRDVQVLGIHIGESRSISSNLGKNIHAIHSDRMGIQSYAIGVRSAINHVNKHGFGSEVLSNVKRGAIDEIREMKEKAPYIVYKSLPKAVEQSILIDYLSDRTCKRDIVREFSESYKPAPDALGSLATKN
jgi:hypothetical protein